MIKEKIISKLLDCGIVAVVRAESIEEAEKIAEACIAGGVAGIELTFTVPNADKIIASMAAKYSKGEIIIGAGTVLDPETARIAILNGAEFIVSPATNLDTIKLCNRYRVPVMAGVMTPTEAITAMEAGSDILKIFPAGLFGPKVISNFLAPLPQAMLMPTGGVSIDNVAEWINAGAVAVGAGSSLTEGTAEEITARAKKFISAIKVARKDK